MLLFILVVLKKTEIMTREWEIDNKDYKITGAPITLLNPTSVDNQIHYKLAILTSQQSASSAVWIYVAL